MDHENHHALPSQMLHGRVCSCTDEHAEARGLNLKNTESYTYVMTDLIHKAFAYAVSVQSKVAHTLVAIMAEPIPIEKTLKYVRSAFDPRNYKDVPLARVDYGSDHLWHDGEVKAKLIPDAKHQPRGLAGHVPRCGRPSSSGTSTRVSTWPR